MSDVTRLKHFSACYLFQLLATKNLHLTTIFLQLVAKRRLQEFFNFEPCQVIKITTNKIKKMHKSQLRPFFKTLYTFNLQSLVLFSIV